MILALLVMFFFGGLFGLVAAALLAANRNAERVQEAFRLGVRVGTQRAIPENAVRARVMRAA
jgi:hypothetical protein